jgi:anti-sigma-K factor RskA
VKGVKTMNLLSNSALLDHLASSYALGTLRGGARRRFETLARESVTIRTAAHIWQERLAAMTELQPASIPSPNVWKRIANEMDVSAAASAASARPAPLVQVDNSLHHQILSRLRRSVGLWRGTALATGLATVAAVGVGLSLSTQVKQKDLALVEASQAVRQSAMRVVALQAESRIDYVAVLADDKATASMLVTYDPRKNTLTVKRVGGYQTAFDRSLQLWALPGLPGDAKPGAAAAGPQSLGVLGDGDVIRLTANESSVKNIPALAISLEPKGGVPSETGPTGPVLFKGALIQTVL